MISFEDFQKVACPQRSRPGRLALLGWRAGLRGGRDVRVGKIVKVQDFPEARKPAYKLEIDFGPEIGVKKSSVQIADLYTKEKLVGFLVLGVVNFLPKQIGPFVSEVLTLGVPDSARRAKIGGKLF